MTQELWMREALKEADLAVREGNHPFGMVIVSSSGELVVREHNRVVTQNNPLAHAELLAIQQLCERSRERDFRGSTAFVTSESCPMCLTACLKFGIDHYVFGAPMEQTARLYLPPKFVLREFRGFPVHVTYDFLREDCLSQRLQAGVRIS